MVSEHAVLVIAGVMPIDLLVEERGSTRLRKGFGFVGSRTVAMKHSMLRREQEFRTRWTVMLVGNLAVWVDRTHGEVDYFLTQFFAWHEYVSVYPWELERWETRRVLLMTCPSLMPAIRLWV